MKKIILSNSTAMHSLFFKGFAEIGWKPLSLIGEDYHLKTRLTIQDICWNTILRFFGKHKAAKEIVSQKISKYKKLRAEKLLKENNIFDFAFIISPQDFEKSQLQSLLKQTKKKIAYHWDGISRFEGMTKNDDLFDRVYVFDPADADAEKYFSTTNCYFDDPQIGYPKDFEIYYNTFFSEEKIETLSGILKNLPRKDAKISVRVFNEEQANFARGKLGDSVQIETETQDYRHILDITKKAKVLLDIKAKEHNGLSFRFFEAMCYKSKVITNNSSVKDYDFYRPENIFVFNADTKSEELREFLNLPYCEIPEEIRLRYYFPNWFERMVDF